jgi:tRNA(His) guanylyltransferase
MKLGDRMKMYERAEAGRTALPGLPVVIRLDGKTFSKWTRGLERPYDSRLSDLMVETTRHLVKETGACIGYTQSDEITLVLAPHGPNSEPWLGGKLQKLVSITASQATAFFNAAVLQAIPEKAGKLAVFDSRAWVVPSREEAVNALLWRELDATKNSISMATRHYYSHKQMHKKTGSEMQDMLHAVGVNWNDYPAFFKRGSFLRRVVVERTLTPAELEGLPERHDARRNPDLVVTRSSIEVCPMPPFMQVVNRADVVFEGAEPQVAQ